ncbi:MAG TPA: hypothetical protein VFC78_15035 [Tepidisphaeraceae bacterium]|nr:hypothetical protein [Tepidisphaeraceae bacterium]
MRMSARAYRWFFPQIACPMAIALSLLLACLLRAAKPVVLDPAKPAAKLVIQGQVDGLEVELAGLLQRRADASGQELALLDLRIDLRLIERWMLSASLQAPPEDPLPPCALLRVKCLEALNAEVSQRLKASPGALSPGQMDGVAKLHQLTYKLPGIKNVGVLDAVCREIAGDLIAAANPAPAELKNLPAMRPVPLPSNVAAQTQAAQAPRTLGDLAAQAKAADVSPALKRQLEILALQADAAAADPKAREQAAELYDVLSSAVDLADGLSHNTGLDSAARPKIEQRLVEGLTLISDVRTRPAGKSRLAALGQYHDTLVRVQRLHIPAPLQAGLAPVFVWVNKNPSHAAAALGAVEKYLQLCARADARKGPGELPPNSRRAVLALQKQFAAQRAGFLEDAAGLSDSDGILSGGSDSLAIRVEQMGQLLEGAESIEKLPLALRVLNAYHPRPGGGLERRVAKAMAEMGSPIVAGARDQGGFVGDLERLAQLAADTQRPSDLSPRTLKLYTHDRLDAVESRRVALIGAQAFALAGGKEIDPAELARLQTLRALYDSLPQAAEVQSGLDRASTFSSWADWSISPAQLQALIGPYRDATAAAFDGFADDNSTPVTRWADVRKRFLPLLALTREMAAYADQCDKLPTGLAGELAKLFTPMDHQPFAAQRNVSFAVAIWRQAAQTAADPHSADLLFDAMLGQLRKDLHLSN